uniref:Uncharacterized protein n=1 Tax=Rhizophora mucronata TaxID=61149 RepID=A0A2P2MCS0_RHIMU
MSSNEEHLRLNFHLNFLHRKSKCTDNSLIDSSPMPTRKSPRFYAKKK